MVTVKDIMHTMTVIDADKTVMEAAELMVVKNIGAALVRHNGEVSGIFTERDMMRRIVARGEDPRSVLVQNIMNPIRYTVHPDADISEASERMARYGIRRLPVVDTGGKFVGMLSMRDIAKALPGALLSKKEARAELAEREISIAGEYFQ